MTGIRRPSLVHAVTEELLSGLKRGAWIGSLPGERQLCEQLMVSRPTLRQALEKLEKDGLLTSEPGKRRLIVPQTGAIKNPDRLKHIVFLSSRELTEMEPSAVLEIDQLRRQLNEFGYRLQVSAIAALSKNCPRKKLEHYVRNQPAAAWVLYRSSRSVQRWFAEQGYPALIMGTAHENIALPSVDVDFRATARHAVGQFRRLGHDPQRLFMLAADESLAGIDEGIAGFWEGVGAPPGSADPQIITFGTVDELGRRLNRLFQGPIVPSGLIVQRSTHALSTLGYLMAQLGRVPPKDISLVALSNDPMLRYAVPEITRYSINPAGFAHQLIRILMKIVEGNHSVAPIHFMPEMLKGKTLAPPSVI